MDMRFKSSPYPAPGLDRAPAAGLRHGANRGGCAAHLGEYVYYSSCGDVRRMRPDGSENVGYASCHALQLCAEGDSLFCMYGVKDIKIGVLDLRSAPDPRRRPRELLRRRAATCRPAAFSLSDASGRFMDDSLRAADGLLYYITARGLRAFDARAMASREVYPKRGICQCFVAPGGLCCVVRARGLAPRQSVVALRGAPGRCDPRPVFEDFFDARHGCAACDGGLVYVNCAADSLDVRAISPDGGQPRPALTLPFAPGSGRLAKMIVEGGKLYALVRDGEAALLCEYDLAARARTNGWALAEYNYGLTVIGGHFYYRTGIFGVMRGSLRDGSVEKLP